MQDKVQISPHIGYNQIRKLEKGVGKMNKAANYIFLCLFWGCVMVLWPVEARAETQVYEMFFENPCASCNEEDEIYEIFKDTFSVEERQNLDYQLNTYNVFQSANMEVYEERLREYGLEKNQVELPVLRVGTQWISGYDEIEANLRDVLMGGEEISVPGQESETDRDSGDALKKSLDSLKSRGYEKEQQVMVLFTTYSCKDCQQVKDYIERENLSGEAEILELNIAEDNWVEVVQAFFQEYQVEDSQRSVPILFYGDSFLSGAEEIQKGIKDGIAGKEAGYERLEYHLEGMGEKNQGRADTSFNLLTLAGAGLLAGFNPCSISMLLMLFSLLVTAKASVLKNGALYIGGKYITYLGLGLGIYFLASGVEENILNQAGRVINLVIIILLVAAAIMNFLDFANVRKKEYGKVRMQLPAGLRRFNHNMIKNAEKASGGLLLLVVLGLGIAISLGEFFCTGQVYMASILYMLRSQSGTLVHILPLFLVYVTAMCIPTVVFILFIHKTKNTNAVSEFMLKHMDWVKLANTFLFLAFALYFILNL